MFPVGLLSLLQVNCIRRAGVFSTDSLSLLQVNCISGAGVLRQL